MMLKYILEQYSTSSSSFTGHDTEPTNRTDLFKESSAEGNGCCGYITWIVGPQCRMRRNNQLPQYACGGSHSDKWYNNHPLIETELAGPNIGDR
ncbi:hypothetical protein I7I50_12010 [Histoplasma capsulatum G186AR]|uniref:Uncharacterized protein n=1 Tax=Ajellomyces capsulatus TaxID=5037 RepID=A0A8H7YAS7_AJECA|nr:hypothetical protein I7I52_11723 [Histoplasma capsulatum]QSS70393.1 hypothetical protein I7I50_12010 [Histoplasma capsulatum G186AR]